MWMCMWMYVCVSLVGGQSGECDRSIRIFVVDVVVVVVAVFCCSCWLQRFYHAFSVFGKKYTQIHATCIHHIHTHTLTPTLLRPNSLHAHGWKRQRQIVPPKSVQVISRCLRFVCDGSLKSGAPATELPPSSTKYKKKTVFSGLFFLLLSKKLLVFCGGCCWPAHRRRRALFVHKCTVCARVSGISSRHRIQRNTDNDLSVERRERAERAMEKMCFAFGHTVCQVRLVAISQEFHRIYSTR